MSRILLALGVVVALVVTVVGSSFAYGYGHTLGTGLGAKIIADKKASTQSIAQLKAKLDDPSNFVKKDWSTDWTRTIASGPQTVGDPCTLTFTSVDYRAGLPTVVDRQLYEDSTTHQINEHLGSTSSAAAVISAEKQAVSGCGASRHFTSSKGDGVTYTMAPLSPSSVGVPANRPALCRTLTARSADPRWEFAGDYCSIVIGKHVLQVREISADPDNPVTRVGFESIVTGESDEVAGR